MRSLLALLTAVLLLPLLGVYLAGYELAPYLEFPPHTAYVKHAPFSLPVFLVYLVFSLASLSPFVWRYLRRKTASSSKAAAGRWPAWGWAGLMLLAAAWAAAWTRLPALRGIQAHTFFPLWLGYIITANALGLKLGGACPLQNRPARYLMLFPISAIFWWSFEYLNRFVQNWSYLNTRHFTPTEYFFFASLSFKTVLPAVSATQALLSQVSSLRSAFAGFIPISFPWSQRIGGTLLIAALGVLTLTGIWPNMFFPALWLLPLIVLALLQHLAEFPSILAPIAKGNWSEVVSWSLAALICGFFWELWNYFSLCKWVYHVPYVQVFSVFEMPLLGYAGYLPFGVFCGAVTTAVMPRTQELRGT